MLFGLPTVASVLNIAVNLYGDRILLAMLTEPEAVPVEVTREVMVESTVEVTRIVVEDKTESDATNSNGNAITLDGLDLALERV